MKRMVMVTALLLMMLSVQGQDARVAEIRKMYAEAKAQMAKNGKNGMAPLDVTITVNDGTQVDEDFIINEQRELTFYFNSFYKTGVRACSTNCKTCCFHLSSVVVVEFITVTMAFVYKFCLVGFF